MRRAIIILSHPAFGGVSALCAVFSAFISVVSLCRSPTPVTPPPITPPPVASLSPNVPPKPPVNEAAKPPDNHSPPRTVSDFLRQDSPWQTDDAHPDNHSSPELDVSDLMRNSLGRIDDSYRGMHRWYNNYDFWAVLAVFFVILGLGGLATNQQARR